MVSIFSGATYSPCASLKMCFLRSMIFRVPFCINHKRSPRHDGRTIIRWWTTQINNNLQEAISRCLPCAAIHPCRGLLPSSLGLSNTPEIHLVLSHTPGAEKKTDWGVFLWHNYRLLFKWVGEKSSTVMTLNSSPLLHRWLTGNSFLPHPPVWRCYRAEEVQRDLQTNDLSSGYINSLKLTQKKKHQKEQLYLPSSLQALTLCTQLCIQFDRSLHKTTDTQTKLFMTNHPSLP